MEDNLKGRAKDKKEEIIWKAEGKESNKKDNLKERETKKKVILMWHNSGR